MVNQVPRRGGRLRARVTPCVKRSRRPASRSVSVSQLGPLSPGTLPNTAQDEPRSPTKERHESHHRHPATDRSPKTSRRAGARSLPLSLHLGCEATLASERPFREVRSGKHHRDTTLLELELQGRPVPDPSTVLAKLERFLKQSAKDTSLGATFELFLEHSEH